MRGQKESKATGAKNKTKAAAKEEAKKTKQTKADKAATKSKCSPFYLNLDSHCVNNVALLSTMTH